MRYLLDRLHTELLTLLPTITNNSPFVGLPQGKSTIVTAIFGGILQNEVNCLICGMESKKHDPFLGGILLNVTSVLAILLVVDIVTLLHNLLLNTVQ